MEICGITCALTLHLHTLVNSCREREIAVNKKITQNVFSKTDSKVRTNCMIEKLIFIKGQNCWTNETPSYKKKRKERKKGKKHIGSSSLCSSIARSPQTQDQYAMYATLCVLHAQMPLPLPKHTHFSFYHTFCAKIIYM